MTRFWSNLHQVCSKSKDWKTKQLKVSESEISKSFSKDSAWFTYRLDRLRPRASIFRRVPAKVYNIVNAVIGLPHLCCHNVLYFLSNPSVIFLTQLHSITEYCRILNTPHHLLLYWNWLNTLPSSPNHEGGDLGGALQVK